MQEILNCPWEPAQYFIFSSNVPSLLFYSHFTAVLTCIVLSILILNSDNRRQTTSKLLLSVLVLFSMWSLIDLVVWATNTPSVALFWWSIIVIIEPIIFILAFYLFYKTLFSAQRITVPNLITFLLLLPLFLLAPTSLNLSGINLYDCVATEGYLAQWYTYIIELIAAGAILVLAIKYFFTGQDSRLTKVKNVLFSFGLLIFLFLFSAGNIIGSIGGTTEDWEIAQYGLFGMPIFIGLLTYLIVRYKIYSLKLFGAQALVLSLWILVGSLLFIAQSVQTRVVAGMTLLLVSVFGFILVRSVKREIKQREEIAKLAENLKQANERLQVLDRMKSEFVSIASHQLRSPLTSIRGYASMLAEGSYGKLPKKAQGIIENIAESAKYMALSVEDYLNVSRIEAGNMKYEMSDFDLKKLTEKIVDEMRPVALKKGLVLMFRSDCNGSCHVNADIGKTRQILLNLIDNAIKYTPKGSITLVAHDDVKAMKMYVSIHDTGVGMSKNSIEDLFEKFVRARNANSVNVTGTGLGLYVVRNMIQAMGGTVTAQSEGEGKGSIFRIEFPLLLGKARQ